MSCRSARGVVVCALVLFGCAGSLRDLGVQASIQSYGRYDLEAGPLVYESGQWFRSFDSLNREPFEVTREIPCRLGESFGAMFLAAADPDARRVDDLEVVWVHPLIQDGARAIVGTTTRYPADIPVEPGGTAVIFGAWSFDNQADLVAGEWTVSLVRADEVLASQSFSILGCSASEARLTARSRSGAKAASWGMVD